MYHLSTHDTIDAIPAADWNRLTNGDSPFLRHEFLAAMERHGCVGEALGWLPRHLALRDTGGRLVAAAPCYLKFNSYGELVFDWSWADAYRRQGLAYYPKLVVASPYTPATGPRLLDRRRPRGRRTCPRPGGRGGAGGAGVGRLLPALALPNRRGDRSAGGPRSDAAGRLSIPLDESGLSGLR